MCTQGSKLVDAGGDMMASNYRLDHTWAVINAGVTQRLRLPLLLRQHPYSQVKVGTLHFVAMLHLLLLHRLRLRKIWQTSKA